MNNNKSRQEIYNGDSFVVQRVGRMAKAQKVPYGEDVEGRLFDGYPEIIKGEETQPTHLISLKIMNEIFSW